MTAALKHRLNQAIDRTIQLLDDLRAEKVAANDMEAAAQLACKIDGVSIARSVCLTVLTDWEKDGGK